MNPVLLINPKDTGFDAHNFSPPLGLLYMGAYLEQNGIGCDVIDGCVEEEKIGNYEVVGIPCFTIHRWKAFDLALRVKKSYPKTRVVLGGAHATIMSKQIKDNFPVDVIKGEGERPLLDYVNGVPPREEQLPIDEIPMPLWDRVKFNRYPAKGRLRIDFGRVNGVWIGFEPRFPIVASRGCPGHCSFCSSWWIWKKYRTRNPVLVVDEMQMLYEKYKVRHFSFTDDTFGVDKEKSLRLCSEILERKMKIAWQISTRADCIDEERVNTYKRAGCYAIGLGIESGSRTILRGIHKDTDLETLERAIRQIVKAGIFVNCLLIIGNIGETDETIRETKDFLKRARPSTASSACGLWIMPGTNTYTVAKKEGVISDEFWLSRDFPLTWKYSDRQLNKWKDEISKYDWRVYLRRIIGKWLR